MSILDNEGHDPSGLGNQPVLFNAPIRAQILKLEAEIERLRAALEKIAGRREYSHEDHERAARYKRDEGIWTTDEYLADVALGQQ